VDIKDDVLRKKQEEHAEEPAQLRKALGLARWTYVKKVEDSPNPTPKFWPGQVLVGHVDREELWAYLYSRDSDGGSGILYGVAEATIGPNELPRRTDFAPWYLALTEVKQDPTLPGKNWRANTMALVSLAMLDAGLYDGYLPAVGSMGNGSMHKILTKIRENHRGKRARSKTDNDYVTPGPSRRRTSEVSASFSDQAHVSHPH
jgi:hypothetical protein